MYLIFIFFFGKTSEFQNVFTELFLTVEDLYVQWLWVFLHLDFNSFQCKKQSLLMNQIFTQRLFKYCIMRNVWWQVNVPFS